MFLHVRHSKYFFVFLLCFENRKFAPVVMLFATYSQWSFSALLFACKHLINIKLYRLFDAQAPLRHLVLSRIFETITTRYSVSQLMVTDGLRTDERMENSGEWLQLQATYAAFVFEFLSLAHSAKWASKSRRTSNMSLHYRVKYDHLCSPPMIEIITHAKR